MTQTQKTFDQILDGIRASGDPSMIQMAEMITAFTNKIEGRIDTFVNQHSDFIKQQQQQGVLTSLGINAISPEKITEFESQLVPNTPFTYAELKERAITNGDQTVLKTYADALKSFSGTTTPAPAQGQSIPSVQSTPSATPARETPTTNLLGNVNTQPDDAKRITDFINGKITEEQFNLGATT